MEESETPISGFSLFTILGAAAIGMAMQDPERISDMMHRKAPRVRIGKLLRHFPEEPKDPSWPSKDTRWPVVCAYLDAHQRWSRDAEREKKRRKRVEEQLDVAHERIRAQAEALDSLAYLLPLHTRLQALRALGDELAWLAEPMLPRRLRDLMSFVELRGVE